jgi:signal transduction histidine kinase/ActR/RegA family two-component response regulator
MPSASSSPTAANAPGLDALVRGAQLEMVVDRSRSSNLISVPFAAVVVWLLWGAVDHRLLLAWLALKAAGSTLRILVTRAFDRSRPHGVERWGRRFIAAIAVDSAVFGLLGTLLLPVDDPALMATMIATLLGIASIGLVVLSMSFAASLALTVPVMLPAMLMQFTRGEALSTYIGIGMVVFLGLVVVEGRRAADHTRAMLRLRFQMDDLARQRQQALDEAERSNAVKSQFLATMSHEMRTPLHGLLGLTRLLQQQAGGLPAERLAILERTGEHLLAIINEVLEYARIESGHLRLQAQAFDLRALLGSVVELMQAAALEKGLGLRFVDELPQGAHYLGDPHRLRQVLLNLAGNAVKFTERGGVTIIAGQAADGVLRIEVADTGPGVPEADRERIFDAFRQLDGSFARRHGGTGLGLTISRHLVQAMGGSLVCLAAPGGGALFRVHVALPATSAPASPAAQAVTDSGLPLRGRVLLVEDNPVNAMVAEAALQMLGLTVHSVGDGEQAVACAMSEAFDLILMDCQMPGIDGFEATSRIRRHEEASARRRTPIVALTANAMSGDRERSLAAGMDDHLAKPFRAEELAAVLRRRLPPDA